MKKQIAYLIVAATLTAVPLAFSTGCAVTRGKETVGEYSKDKEIQGRIKTALYADPVARGTETTVQSFRGVVQLSGFVSSLEAKQRAEEIAASTPGVVKLYNNLLLSTGPASSRP